MTVEEVVAGEILVGDEVQLYGGDILLKVYAVRESFILAVGDGVYTIIMRIPTNREWKHIPKGSIIAGPDEYVGYWRPPEPFFTNDLTYDPTYRFDDPEWLQQYVMVIESEGRLYLPLCRVVRELKVYRDDKLVMGTEE